MIEEQEGISHFHLRQSAESLVLFLMRMRVRVRADARTRAGGKMSYILSSPEFLLQRRGSSKNE